MTASLEQEVRAIAEAAKAAAMPLAQTSADVRNNALAAMAAALRAIRVDAGLPLMRRTWTPPARPARRKVCLTA